MQNLAHLQPTPGPPSPENPIPHGCLCVEAPHALVRILEEPPELECHRALI